VPAAILTAGCILNLSVVAQRSMPLRNPLRSMPPTLDQVKVAGTTSSLLRVYQRDTTLAFSVYVGYYDRQRQGRTIHSPKNCLPGGGWEPLESREEQVQTSVGLVRLNRFVIAKKNDRALVYYWYQGRGRTESNEYRVKLDLIRDSALKRRSEEALVRIVMPIGSSNAAPDSLGHAVVQELAQQLENVLPT
jgi:EpsI family protein